MLVRQLAPIAPLGLCCLSKRDTPQTPCVNTSQMDTKLSWERDHNVWHALFAIPQKSQKRLGWTANGWANVNYTGWDGLSLGPSACLLSPSPSFAFFHPFFLAGPPLIAFPFVPILSSSSSVYHYFLKNSKCISSSYPPKRQSPLGAQGIGDSPAPREPVEFPPYSFWPAGPAPVLEHPTDTCASVYISQRSGKR